MNIETKTYKYPPKVSAKHIFQSTSPQSTIATQIKVDKVKKYIRKNIDKSSYSPIFRAKYVIIITEVCIDNTSSEEAVGERNFSQLTIAIQYPRNVVFFGISFCDLFPYFACLL